eukprot:scaffold1129_cov376-Prasinococcus_capsulatus_cf.AAC.10
MASLTPLKDWQWLLIICPLVSVLSWLRSMRLLAPTSSLGLLALLFAIVVTSVDLIQHGEYRSLDNYAWFRVKTYPSFIGNAAFLYLISTAVLPIEQGMREPKKFPYLFLMAAIFVTVLNLAFGMAAYLGYGDCEKLGLDSDDLVRVHIPCVFDLGRSKVSDPAMLGQGCTQGNVVDNLQPGITTKLVKIFLSLDLLFTGLVFLFPFNQAFEKEILGEREYIVKIGNAGFDMTPWLKNAMRTVVSIMHT